VRYEVVFQVGDCFFELFLILDELSGGVKGVFEGLDFIVLVADSVSLLCDFGFECFLIFEEGGDELCQPGVQ
jgi:hypothetical protein